MSGAQSNGPIVRDRAWSGDLRNKADMRLVLLRVKRIRDEELLNIPAHILRNYVPICLIKLSREPVGSGGFSSIDLQYCLMYLQIAWNGG